VNDANDLSSTFAVFEWRFLSTWTSKQIKLPVYPLMLTQRIGKKSDMVRLRKAACRYFVFAILSVRQIVWNSEKQIAVGAL